MYNLQSIEDRNCNYCYFLVKTALQISKKTKFTYYTLWKVTQKYCIISQIMTKYTVSAANHIQVQMIKYYLHCVCLPRGCLSICKYCSIVSLKYIQKKIRDFIFQGIFSPLSKILKKLLQNVRKHYKIHTHINPVPNPCIIKSNKIFVGRTMRKIQMSLH